MCSCVAMCTLPFTSRHCMQALGPDRRLHAAYRDARSCLLVHVLAHPTARAHFTARARRTRWSVVRVLTLVSCADVTSAARLVVGNRPDPAVNSLLDFMSSVGAMSMQVPFLPLGMSATCGLPQRDLTRFWPFAGGPGGFESSATAHAPSPEHIHQG